MAVTRTGAIEEKFSQAVPLTTTCPGGLWTDFAPEGTSEPYCVLTDLGSVPEFTTGPLYKEVWSVQLTVYGSDGPSVKDAIDDIKTAFDWCQLPLEGGEVHVAMRRTNQFGPRMEEYDAGQNPSWQGMLEYEITIAAELPKVSEV